MDYRQLLIKYINHVGAIEGVSFISEQRWSGEDIFTDEEWAELVKLDQEPYEIS